MPGDNVDTVRGWFEEFERSGIDAVIDYVHPEFEGVVPAALSVEPDTYRGKEGAQRYVDSFNEVMDEIRFVPDEFIAVGDNVVVVPMRVVARGKETGIEVEQQAVQVWTVKDGLALHVEAYPTREDALEAAAAS
jgi:ketosteroid isomerase-like protein